MKDRPVRRSGTRAGCPHADGKVAYVTVRGTKVAWFIPQLGNQPRSVARKEQAMIEEPYRFVELDPDTRAFMLAELDLDLNQHGRPYQGKFLTEKGLADYEQLLRESITGGD